MINQKNYQEMQKIILKNVQAPGQYVGGEPNQIIKPTAKLKIALGFPDVYTIGMSHLGLRILYELANSIEGVAAERIYAPLPDMEEQLRKYQQPLTTLETATPLLGCNIIAFSLSYELAATSVLTMLDLAHIPLTRQEREDTDYPLIFAGGMVTTNPEPFTDFIDLFMIGEGEESLSELLLLYLNYEKVTKENRQQFFREAAKIEGVYIPSLYKTKVTKSQKIVVDQPIDQESTIPNKIKRRIVHDFENMLQVTKPVVPIHETTHERAVIEVMRGCPNGCRFCQAGYITRPLRERKPETLLAAAREIIKNTGYDEVGLLSLSTSNYSSFDKLLDLLDKEFTCQGVSISLPSLRVDHVLSEIPKRIKSVRKSGLTIAPEAGSDRLRAAINKDVTNEHLLAACKEAYQQGWNKIKLYFMVGLPGETDEDVIAIAQLANQVAKQKRGNNRGAVNLSVSNFVPKPHTPFQWQGSNSPEEWERKKQLVRDNIDKKSVSYSHHDSRVSLLETILARGDRSLGKVMLSAWKNGARLDAWTEHFKLSAWEKAFDQHQLSMLDLAVKDLPLDEELPWQHIDSGVKDSFLKKELEKSLQTIRSPACSKDSCAGCGIEGCNFIKK